MIPLSLYVSMERIKVAQIFLMNNDIDMYDKASNTPFEARTSTINEELGQVSYIFSDKTGTLTDNVMKFRKLSVAGTVWLHDEDLKNLPTEDEFLLYKKRNAKGKGKLPLRRILRKSTSNTPGATDVNNNPRKSTSSAAWKSSCGAVFGKPDLSTADLIRYIQRRPQTAFARKATMILSIALCHTCLPEHGKSEDDVSYQAASLDELALVEAARELGFFTFDRDVSTSTLKIYPRVLSAEPVLERYEILDVIEFSSKRRRMSVVTRFSDGRICVICKGANTTVIGPRTIPSPSFDFSTSSCLCMGGGTVFARLNIRSPPFGRRYCSI